MRKRGCIRSENNPVLYAVIFGAGVFGLVGGNGEEVKEVCKPLVTVTVLLANQNDPSDYGQPMSRVVLAAFALTDLFRAPGLAGMSTD